MRTILSGPVGPGRKNDPDDIRRVRAALRTMKGEDIDPNQLSGYTDAEIEHGIRDFQEQKGLKVDDWMAQGGETDRNMVAGLTGEGLDTATAQEVSLRQAVGSGGANGTGDVQKMKRALGTLGYLKYDRTAPPPPYIDAKTVEAIQGFQRDNALFEDGRVKPGGETEQAVKERLAEQQKKGVQTAGLVKGAVIGLVGREAAKKAFPWLFKKSPPKTPSTTPKSDPRKEAVDRMGRDATIELGRKSGEETARKAEEEQKKRKPTLLTDPTFRTPVENKSPDKMEHIPPKIPEIDPEEGGFQPHERDRKDGILAGPDPDAPPVILIDKPEGFPLPDKPEDLIEIFPDEREKWSKPFILENRGKEETIQLNTEVLRRLFEGAKRKGMAIEHIGGARNQDGQDEKEFYMRGKESKGRLGSNHIDVSIRNKRNGRQLHVNSTSTYVDGLTPDKRESRAIPKILANKKEDALGVGVPKPLKGQTLNWKAIDEFFDYLLDELDRDEFVTSRDNANSRPAADQWHQWKGPLK